MKNLETENNKIWKKWTVYTHFNDKRILKENTKISHKKA